MNHPEHPAKTPSPRTGLFATLRGLLPARGSGVPSRTLLATPLIALCAFLAPAVAQASPPGLISSGQVESNLAVGVALDNSGTSSQGDLYVGSFFNLSSFQFGHLEKFDSSGGLLAPPSPFGEAFVYSGMALDPANGNLYALSEGFSGTTLEAFDPQTGAPIAAPFSVPPSANFSTFFGNWTIAGIAFDSIGDVYVPVAPENKVLEYESIGTNEWTLKKTFTGGSGTGALKDPLGVAVDSTGDVWVADAGNERIEQLGPTDEPLAEIPAVGAQSLALDSHGHLFTVLVNEEDSCGALKPPCPHLVEYDASGARLADLGAATIGAQRDGETEGGSKGIPEMVSVDDSDGRVYVTEAVEETGAGRVLIYAPPTAPTVNSELAIGITVTQAKLGARLSPGGIDTSYRFEYGETTAYGHSAPFPEGDAGTGLDSRTVWASLSGLKPGTTYHYRVVVTNELGEEVGTDKIFTTPTTAQATCPNDAFRTGFSTALPDCRAYELVTPPNKVGAQPDKDQGGSKQLLLSATLEHNLAADDGNRLTYKSEDVQPGSLSAGQTYLATRTSSGWLSENLFPATDVYGYECADTLRALAFSADLSKAIIPIRQVGDSRPDPIKAELCGTEKELVASEPRNVRNLFLRDNETGTYQLIDLTPAGVTATEPELFAASPDLSHIFFSEEAKLTPDATEGVQNRYEWHAGQLRLLPSGFITLSDDGSHLFYAEAGNLYATGNSGAPVQLDASQAAGPGGGGHFVADTSDGSLAFFTDDASAGLTADTVPGSGTNLYRYDFAAEQLTDLTPAAHAELTRVLGVSRDGAAAYFTANGALVSGATQGQPNPYLWRSSGTTFLAPLAGASFERFQISPNGAFFALESTQSLTGYDNTAADGKGCFLNGSFEPTGSPQCPELFLYSAAAEALSCASCNPSGQNPTPGASPLGAELPIAGAGFENNTRVARNLTENGRLFFDTTEALLPSDTNGQFDVYEYEPDGVGTCSEVDGCVSVISSGTSSRATFFINSSASGTDAFLRTYQSLVPSDRQGEATRIYDARVDGGLPEPVSAPPCATADACRAAPRPQPSISTGPASSNYSGSGNVKPPPKHHPKKMHHAKHKPQHGRHATANSGGHK